MHCGICEFGTYHRYGTISMVVADGLVPIWQQDICNHHGEGDWLVHFSPEYTVLMFCLIHSHDNFFFFVSEPSLENIPLSKL